MSFTTKEQMMNQDEIQELTAEGYPVLTRKLWRIGAAAPVKLASGSVAYHMGTIENLSVNIIESQPGIEFEDPGHPEECLVLVLEGLVLYENARSVRREEAVFHLPNKPYRGKYAGTESVRLLSIKITPKPGTKPPNADLMQRVIRLVDVEPFKIAFATGTSRRILVQTENVSASVGENWPVMEFEDHGHWDPEIVFGIEGKLEYLDGRSVRPGDMVTNGYNVPHPGRYGGLGPRVRVLEVSTSLYRVGAGFQMNGELLPGYRNGWHQQTLQEKLAETYDDA